MHELTSRDNDPQFTGQSTITLLNVDKLSQIYQDYKKSKQRLILLDYDGTLVPFTTDTQMALPSADLLHTLSLISRNAKNKVVIISNRNKKELDSWLGHLNIDLIAENNTWIKRNGFWLENIPATSEWKIDVLHILKVLSKNLSGAWIEEKDSSIIWHYRFSETDDSDRVVDLIIDHLKSLNKFVHFSVSKEAKSIEIKQLDLDKNISSNFFIRNHDYDFMLAIGDDFSNAETVETEQHPGIPIKFGKENFSANYYMENRNDVIRVINLLIANESTRDKYAPGSF